LIIQSTAQQQVFETGALKQRGIDKNLAHCAKDKTAAVSFQELATK
jgi:hypothetical protein